MGFKRTFEKKKLPLLWTTELYPTTGFFIMPLPQKSLKNS